MRIAVDLYRRFAHLVHELAKFGVIGILNFFVTLGISNTLHTGFGAGPLTSFGVGVVVATILSYFANRFWTFRHRDASGLGREYVLFFVLNGVGLLITWVFIGVTHYVFGLRDVISYNIAQIVGTAVATAFRFWAYKRWVFLPASAPPVDPHTGLPEARAAEPTGSGADTGTETATADEPDPVHARRAIPAGSARRAR